MSETDALSAADLAACSFERWYPSLRQHSIPSTILPLSDEFVEYLKADGVFVDWGEADGADSWDGADDDAEEDEPAPPAPRFPSLEAAIASAIEKHGAVLPKLNWSAPVDAAWMLGGSLRCVSARDVILLLKSSDRIAHDLCDARRLCAPPPETAAAAEEPHAWVLALRKWSNLRPSSEFRCFRSGGRLLAACQRDRYSHYPFLAPESETILQRLARFQSEHLGGGLLPERLVWDAYVDAHGRVFLVDAAPFHESTDPLLFEWAQLRALEQREAPAELRLVEAGAVAPSAGMYHGVPWDLQQQGCDDLQALIARASVAAAPAEERGPVE